MTASTTPQNDMQSWVYGTQCSPAYPLGIPAGDPASCGAFARSPTRSRKGDRVRRTKEQTLVLSHTREYVIRKRYQGCLPRSPFSGKGIDIRNSPEAKCCVACSGDDLRIASDFSAAYGDDMRRSSKRGAATHLSHFRMLSPRLARQSLVRRLRDMLSVKTLRYVQRT
jgi:hypothetical protein